MNDLMEDVKALRAFLYCLLNQQPNKTLTFSLESIERNSAECAEGQNTFFWYVSDNGLTITLKDPRQ